MTMSVGRHLASAAVITAAVALAYPAEAPAEPQEWDVIATADCEDLMGREFVKGTISAETYENAKMHCCIDHGGVWNAAARKCQAPPANPVQVQPRNIPTQTLTREPPPAMSPGSTVPTVTFAPAG
ncbi:MAG: hypothetical protein ACM4D3_02605 [Candidatus Sericytochromatia bacterium]